MRVIPRIQVADGRTNVTQDEQESEDFPVTPGRVDDERAWSNPQACETRALRDRAAVLIQRQRGDIYRRIQKLMLPEARRITDTEDVLSTALRRVDSLIARQKFVGMEEEQVYALVHAVLERAIKEKARNARRLRSREHIAAQIAGMTELGNIFPTQSICERIGAMTPDPLDREIALLRGRGLKFHEIASAIGMQPSGVRKRWARLKSRAQEVVDQEGDDADR